MESRSSSVQEDERIVQVRQALMCPNGGRVEGLRTARFLNYTTTSIDDDVFELPVEAFTSRAEKSPVNFSFSGWGSPSVNWIEWVNTMAESHEAVWRKSGVYDAIMASRYQIKKQDDLMMALVEKWCIETNSFVFPWGEATVTLEDMIVLGGFSAIGNNVLGSIKRESMKSIEENLKKAKHEIEANSMKKCCVSLWMKEMMNSGNEIEHEAFMVSWLSRFVFPNSGDLVRDKLFAAAVQLAKGYRLALAPAVLAGIYSNLGVLKKQLDGYGEEEETVVAMAKATAPFQFVQVWAWERIREARPLIQPNQLKPYEPRMALWHQHGNGQELNQNHEEIRRILDSAKESFDYRPYTKPLKNFRSPKFYLEEDCWVSLEDEDIVAFGRCLRCSKLVGLNCIEPYYPHRVALQFGYDQDVPGVVPVRTETPESAWKDYIRPILDETLYIPSSLHQADVTVKYIRWWKQSVSTLQSMAKRSSQKLLKEKQAEIIATTMARKAEAKVKRLNGTINGGAKSTLKKTELNKKSSPRLTKSPERELKGALRSSQEPKGHHGHVKFTLPDSVNSLPKDQKSLPPKQNSKGSSPVTKPNSIKKPNSPKPQPSKIQNVLPSSRFRPVISKKSPRRSSETSKQSSSSKASPASNIDKTKTSKEESLKETQLSCKRGEVMNALSLIGEVMALEEHVGEGGEVMYQIPKQHFEVLRQGVEDVLHELQSIKSSS